ncbi:hypothetical protein CFC21_059771 [Triticum aestivum]|uniref:Pectinesterase inhibitor domain-containing protein n=2 Tax=Triticum aestivum TaxID=4565 RepID=A0A9R1GPZ3_WHEAT|nr:pectinesterase inhibitor 12-like [Triticum aestivum]KAF7051537.1 hypothetical protein CFC21_059771 [Triticum aestivum]
MKTSTTTTPALTATVLAAAALILGARSVDAAVADTCKAAAASDVRVNVDLCMSKLGSHRGSLEAADAWGLAKVASLVGVDNANLAAADVKAQEAADPNVRVKPALARCGTLYKDVGMWFAGAHDQISNHAYPAAKQRLDEALAQTQLCNAAFAAAGVTLPQPLALHTVDCIQIAIIAGAITNLIK